MTIAKSVVDRLVVALDVPTAAEALAMARRLQGRVGMLKVGLELFCAEGPKFIREVQAFAPVFLDLKLHDIPTTVHRALEALLRGRTAFVVAHRLSTIRKAGLVLVLDQGRIVERGRHDELLAQKGFYFELYMSQFKKQEEIESLLAQ